MRWPLIVLLVVLGLLGVAVLLPIYVEVGGVARLARAEADVRAIASAVEIYRQHAGTLLDGIEDLARRVTNAQGQPGGPFIDVPGPPAGWRPYRYERTAGGGWRISAETAGPGESMCGQRFSHVVATSANPRAGYPRPGLVDCAIAFWRHAVTGQPR